MKFLQIIREKFTELYEDNDIDNGDLRRKTIQKVMEDLKITNDQISLDYFDLAVQQRSDSDAETEVIEKFRGKVQFLEPITSDEPKKSKEKSSASELIENKAVPLDEIICIIHQKSDRSEIKDFIKDFLFKQIPPIT
jgi:3-isopropylmalate dehydratase small subunit